MSGLKRTLLRAPGLVSLHSAWHHLVYLHRVRSGHQRPAFAVLLFILLSLFNSQVAEGGRVMIAQLREGGHAASILVPARELKMGF